VHRSPQSLRADLRLLVEVEPSASLTLVEAYTGVAGCGRSQLNVLGETLVAESARVTHLRIQDDAAEAQQVNTSITSPQTNSQSWQFTLTSGGALVRNNTHVLLEGQYGEAHLLGLYLGNHRQLIDNHTLVDHRVPNCNSNELYKGALQGKATAVFNGKIYVRRDAQKTNAFQSNRNILLSPGSTVNTKPQLEIYADDVKCSHGTSTGQLDPSALFYLRSRGLGVESARKLLLQAFLDEVVQQVTLPSFQEAVRERVYAWLQQP
jgi:Fe-S cluster assembly protein SufD